MALGPLGQIHVSVRDVDRSVAFYRDVLGVPFLFQVHGQPMAFFASGDVRLYLGTPESADFTTKVALYFKVDDIDAEYARLNEEGVAFHGEPHVVHRDGRTELWMANFQDPDGHHLVLMQERSAGPPLPADAGQPVTERQAAPAAGDGVGADPLGKADSTSEAAVEPSG
jgi:predicted enzyme related to lactoylglutathione lyase